MAVEANTWAWPQPWLGSGERDSGFVYGIAFWLALIQISIAASQIVLAVLVVVWLYRVGTGALALPRLPVDRPLALYAGLSLAAAALSFDPGSSLHASKKLLLLIVPYMLVSTIRRKASLELLVIVLILMADIGALMGLWQYWFSDLGDLNHRIRGFMSHYMTYSGLLMGIGMLGLAQLLFRGKYRAFLTASLACISVALVLSLTRSAWIGMLVGAIVLLLLRDKRLLLVVPVVAATALLVLPRGVEERLGSFVQPDTSGWDRLYMIRAGIGIVSHHPWFGVGPNMVAEVYPVYVDPDAPLRANPHLHNNFMQIAAERGLPCLVAWLWMLGVVLAASIRAFRASAGSATSRALAAGGLGALVAGLLAGLFEYNFGDSEFQMLFLFAMTIPWMLERPRREHRLRTHAGERSEGDA